MKRGESAKVLKPCMHQYMLRPSTTFRLCAYWSEVSTTSKQSVNASAILEINSLVTVPKVIAKSMQNSQAQARNIRNVIKVILPAILLESLKPPLRLSILGRKKLDLAICSLDRTCPASTSRGSKSAIHDRGEPGGSPCHFLALPSRSIAIAPNIFSDEIDVVEDRIPHVSPGGDCDFSTIKSRCQRGPAAAVGAAVGSLRGTVIPPAWRWNV